MTYERLPSFCTVYLKVELIGLDLLNNMHNVINVFGEIHCFNLGLKTDDIIVKTMNRPQMHFLANKTSNNNN